MLHGNMSVKSITFGLSHTSVTAHFIIALNRDGGFMITYARLVPAPFPLEFPIALQKDFFQNVITRFLIYFYDITFTSLLCEIIRGDLQTRG